MNEHEKRFCLKLFIMILIGVFFLSVMSTFIYNDICILKSKFEKNTHQLEKSIDCLDQNRAAVDLLTNCMLNKGKH